MKTNRKNTSNTMTSKIAKQPRKLKKAFKNSVIIYDVKAVPDGLDMERLFNIYFATGVLFYNNEKGIRPSITPSNKLLKIKNYDNQ